VRSVGQDDRTVLDCERRSGRGACVIDGYTTSTTSYGDIVCLVSGARSSAVVAAS
jgi:hypothetical protein